MDVYEAGACVHHFQAKLPGPIKPVMWGPLQAKEIGLDGWIQQDGGETGMIMHHQLSRAGDGYHSASLIVANGARLANLTIYQAGYNATKSTGSRDLRVKELVGASQILLSRMAGKTIEFHQVRKVELVDFFDEGADEPTPAPPTPTAPTFSKSNKPQNTRSSEIWEL